MTKIVHGNTTHVTKSPTYRSWEHMRRRCYSPTHLRYRSYGGAGIEVCERWRDSFANFLADMGERPTGHEVDRIDPTMGYEPANCQWVTRSANANRRRTCVLVTIRGVSANVTQWARASGTSRPTIRDRLRRGHDSEAAVFGMERRGVLMPEIERVMARLDRLAKGGA